MHYKYALVCRDKTESEQGIQTISRSMHETASSMSSNASRKISEGHRTEVHIDSDRGGLPPDPFESSVHGREVHTATQKQTQKEVQGQLEITRKITATETTEIEHKARTQERVVQGPVVIISNILYYNIRHLMHARQVISSINTKSNCD